MGEITKATALARTQQTSAKKKKAKKATKKPAKKKAKKPKKKAKKKKKKAKKKKKKKKKKKVVKYPGGKRPKGVHKSKAMKASGKKTAAMMKKKGIGLFATKTLSADLAAICGKNKMPRTEVTKAIWVYFKKNKLSKGRTITPDAKLKKVLPSASFSMFKMPGMLSQHMYRTAAAWRNLMTCRRCRVYWSMPFSTRGRETSSPTCGRIWRSLVEG